MNPFLIIIALLLSLAISLPFVKSVDLRSQKDNAEFEAINCPEMLKLDSKYCKPIEGY